MSREVVSPYLNELAIGDGLANLLISIFDSFLLGCFRLHLDWIYFIERLPFRFAFYRHSFGHFL